MRKFRLAGLAGGLGLLAWLVVRSGPARLGADLLKVGWGMAALLAMGIIRQIRSILRGGIGFVALLTPWFEDVREVVKKSRVTK